MFPKAQTEVFFAEGKSKILFEMIKLNNCKIREIVRLPFLWSTKKSAGEVRRCQKIGKKQKN